MYTETKEKRKGFSHLSLIDSQNRRPNSLPNPTPSLSKSHARGKAYEGDNFGSSRLQDESRKTEQTSEASTGGGESLVGGASEDGLGGGCSRASSGGSTRAGGDGAGTVDVGRDGGDQRGAGSRGSGGNGSGGARCQRLGDGARAVGDGQRGSLRDGVSLVIVDQRSGLGAVGGKGSDDLGGVDLGAVGGSRNTSHEGGGGSDDGETHLD